MVKKFSRKLVHLVFVVLQDGVHELLFGDVLFLNQVRDPFLKRLTFLVDDILNSLQVRLNIGVIDILLHILQGLLGLHGVNIGISVI